MIDIEVFSDVVCPWCLIGKRNLEAAIKQFDSFNSEKIDVKIEWRAFQLNPQLPKDGILRNEYTSTKFGGKEQAKIIYERITSAGQSVGLDMKFNRISTQPNSALMHGMIYAAKTRAKENALIEAFFESFFMLGIDLTKTRNIEEVCLRAGIETDLVKSVTNDGKFLDRVEEDLFKAQQLGIQGVPFFIINKTIGLSGAQPPEVIAQAMSRSLQHE